MTQGITLASINHLLEKHPNKVAVIILDNDNTNKNHRFLIANDTTVGQFMNTFRKKVNMTSKTAIYFY